MKFMELLKYGFEVVRLEDDNMNPIAPNINACVYVLISADKNGTISEIGETEDLKAHIEMRIESEFAECRYIPTHAFFKPMASAKDRVAILALCEKLFNIK